MIGSIPIQGANGGFATEGDTMGNAIKVEEVAEIIEPSTEALELSASLVDGIMQYASSSEVATEALLLAFTEILVHREGSLFAHKENAKQMLEDMFNFSVNEHADCIKDMVGSGSSH